MYRFRIPMMAVAIVTGAVLAAAPAALAGAQTGTATPVNVDISQRHLNESEEAIAVNPANPNNIVVFTNVGHAEAGLSAGIFLAGRLACEMLAITRKVRPPSVLSATGT